MRSLPYRLGRVNGAKVKDIGACPASAKNEDILHCITLICLDKNVGSYDIEVPCMYYYYVCNT